MKTNKWMSVACVMAGLACGTAGLRAATPQTSAQAPATAAGAAAGHPAAQLEARYSAMLNDLKAEIVKSLPAVDETQKAAFLQAHQAEMAAQKQLDQARAAMGKIKSAEGLVAHAKGKWIGGADKGIAQSQEMLKKAKTDAEREAAQTELAKWQANREEGLKALKEREEALAKARLEEPKLAQDVKAAEAALEQVRQQVKSALDRLNPKAFLGSDQLDAKLIRFQVLHGATPKGLAAFAAQSPEHQALVESLLGDADLMREMVLADGPNGGRYDQAMKIYTAIRKASPKSGEGLFHRLALAVALEHAVPIKQSNPSDQTDAPAVVDPVNRYLAFEKAYLDGELDPAFKNLTTWDYRYVVDGDEPDWTLAWGRQMLRNYRPDHVSNPDYAWRYVQAVPTEVQYGSQDVKYDLPSLQPYQNMIMNGGVCGRRAFFGRFILRSFGIPTTARPQTGHAALVHWTPSGWVVNLGAGWGSGWTKTVYGDDKNFLQVSQGRNAPEAYLQVQRAHWLGDVQGEKRAYGVEGRQAATGFWNIVAIRRRAQVIEESRAQTLAAVGEELGESNDIKHLQTDQDPRLAEDDRKIVIAADGVITIPAVATSKPTSNSGAIRYMKSYLGGMQLHHARSGSSGSFEYTFDAPSAGSYTLTARVVTTSANQRLLVAANGAAQPTEIAVPFTVGMWDKTPPVQVNLVKGRNVLTFSRNAPMKGLTIKDFTLTPASQVAAR